MGACYGGWVAPTSRCAATPWPVSCARGTRPRWRRSGARGGSERDRPERVERQRGRGGEQPLAAPEREAGADERLGGRLDRFGRELERPHQVRRPVPVDRRLDGELEQQAALVLELRRAGLRDEGRPAVATVILHGRCSSCAAPRGRSPVARGNLLPVSAEASRAGGWIEATPQ